MNLERAVVSILLSGVLLQAEDFNLKFFGDGPIELHTAVTFDGKGERLIARAINRSNAPIQRAKICVTSASLKTGCLFELWNTAVWAPGAELDWNTTTPLKTSDLLHDAMIEEFEAQKAPDLSAAKPIPPAPPAAPPAGRPVPRIEYSATASPRSSTLLVQDGTPVRMRLAQNLSSASAQIGDSVSFEVLDDVTVGDAVVVAGGAIAVATVTASQEKRSLGRAGRLDVTLDYVRSVSGEKIRLRGVQDTKGGGHTGSMTGAMVATAVVFWPAAPLFLFMKGKDVTIPKGHEVTVFVDGDQHIAGLPTVTTVKSDTVSEKPSSRPASSAKPMTNDDVLTLKTAGFGDDLILTKIKNSGAAYSLDTPDLVKLKQAGLSDEIIGAMVRAGESK